MMTYERTNERDERLHRVSKRADAYSGPWDFATISKLCRSKSADDRVLGILVIPNTADEREWFDLARSLIADEDNTCRWQAVIECSNWLKDTPEWVWEVICEFGDSDDDDMRAAIWTCMLEHLLEDYFDEYFPRVKAHVGKASPNFADCVRMSGSFLPEDKVQEFRAFIKSLFPDYKHYDELLSETDDAP